MKRVVKIITLLVLSYLVQPAYPLGLPENVLVVRNANSPVSMSVASYYVAARSIPAGNLVTINTVDSSLSPANEFISPANYDAQIELPIKNFMATNNLTNKIQYIVLTKGVPFKLSANPEPGPTGRSVDSRLAGIDLVDPDVVTFVDENQTPIAKVTINKYWRSPKPFTHAEFGGYLVIRLDGYTEADAKALVDRAIAVPLTPYKLLLDSDFSKGYSDASIQPKWLYLPDGTFDPSYELHYNDYNSDMVRCSQVLAGAPQMSIQLDQTTTFVSDTDLTGYVSWGSNDGSWGNNPSSPSVQVYHNLTFGPRSIVETGVSSSGRSMFRDLSTTQGTQSQIQDLIEQGAAGAKGYMAEPYLDAIASPTALFDLYFSGRNLAESYYGASRFVKWQDIVLGDPLCHLDGTIAANVAAAQALANGTLVSLSNQIVSAGTDDYKDRFYIEDSGRTSGIMVYIGAEFPGIDRNSIVSVRGILGEIDGERAILKPSIVGISATLGASPMRTMSAPSSTTKPTMKLRGQPLATPP